MRPSLAGGDFGYDTGPSKWRASKKEKKFSGYGHFVSIWKKQKDGVWKVTLDCGIENPEPPEKTEALRTVIAEGAAKSATPDEGGRLRAATQQKFAEAAKIDSAAATLEIAGPEIRIYRDGHFPAVGKEAARSLLEDSRGRTSFEVIGGGTSNSADLAYTYGKYSSVRDKGTEAGHYLQIWQTDATGAWKVVLDWQAALPPQK